jgi:hypothetical protein
MRFIIYERVFLWLSNMIKHYAENDFWERLAFFLRAAGVGDVPTVACSGPADRLPLQMHSRDGRCLSRPYKWAQYGRLVIEPPLQITLFVRAAQSPVVSTNQFVGAALY